MADKLFTRFTTLVLWLILICTAGAEERVLFRKASAFAGKVLVVSDGGQRILRFFDQGKQSEQSRCEVARPNYLLHEYTRLQLLGLAFMKTPPRHLLVVGLGGASLPKALHEMYPDAIVDSVEIDPVVAEAARRFFFYREGPQQRTFVEDARHYVRRTAMRYDVVFLDAFDGLEVPLSLRTQEFYREVQSILSPGGVVVANLHRNSPSYSSDRNTLSSVFAHVTAFQGLGNLLLIGHPEARPSDLEERVERLARGYRLSRYLKTLESESNWDLKADVVRDAPRP